MTDLELFRREKDEFFLHDPRNPRSLSHDAVRVVFEDRSGVLWLGTNGGGLNRFDRANGIFQRFRHDPAAPDSLSHDEYGRPRGPPGTLDRTYGGGLDRFDR
jgi:hypothetical protein